MVIFRQRGNNGLVNGHDNEADDDQTCINEPKLIKSVKELVIDYIDCGYRHSYIKTVDKRHYLW